MKTGTTHTDVMFRLLFAFSTVTLVAWAPASADQTDGRLDALFQRLQTTADQGEGQHIAAQIWVIWRQIDDEVTQSLMEQGLRDMSLERYDNALKAFNKVVRAAPDFAEGWNARATLLFLMGDYAGSVADVRRTLALEPRHFGAWSGLGLINMSLGNDAAAVEAFKKALKLNPHLVGTKRNIEFIKKRLQDKLI